MKDAKGHGSNPRGAHQQGVARVGTLHSMFHLPPAPGTAPVPEGYVRLYHQTSEANLGAIKHHGIEIGKAKGIEGPRAVYADERGFYGAPDSVPTVEFAVPRERWDAPFVRVDDKGRVGPENIIAVHHGWHATARYVESNPESIKAILPASTTTCLVISTMAKRSANIKHKYGGGS